MLVEKTRIDDDYHERRRGGDLASLTTEEEDDDADDMTITARQQQQLLLLPTIFLRTRESEKDERRPLESSRWISRAAASAFSIKKNRPNMRNKSG